jgi:hypothetical protein
MQAAPLPRQLSLVCCCVTVPKSISFQQHRPKRVASVSSLLQLWVGRTCALLKVFAGIVHHAHMNGIEVAVKSPKMKIALNPRELKRFEKEIALQAKVSFCSLPASA